MPGRAARPGRSDGRASRPDGTRFGGKAACLRADQDEVWQVRCASMMLGSSRRSVRLLGRRGADQVIEGGQGSLGAIAGGDDDLLVR